MSTHIIRDNDMTKVSNTTMTSFISQDAYIYYPGCSLTGTALEYDLSVRALMAYLGAQLLDIEDWTCCGATAAQAVDFSLALALAARNLALAEKIGSKDETGKNLAVLVPCSACYLNLKQVEVNLEKDKIIKNQANVMLAPENLGISGSLRVRHLLDVLSRDVDIDGLAGAVSQNDEMEHLTVAPYYGCQCLRPFSVFDNPESPKSMDRLILATGAKPLDWDMGGQCCGASTATTKPGVGTKLVNRILDAAHGADCIVTVCPMCQMNLEAFGRGKIPVLYLPQFLGAALGIDHGLLGLDLNLTHNGSVFDRAGQ